MNSLSQQDHDEPHERPQPPSIVDSAPEESASDSDLCGEIRRLEDELQACQQTIDALTAELTSRETQTSAILNSRAWRWVCRYGRVKQGYLVPAYEFLRSFYRNGNAPANKKRRQKTSALVAPRARRLEPEDESIVLLPTPRLRRLGSTDTEPPAPSPARADVICFSIVDWNFRYQRPQQIISQFAAHGHRVFYIRLDRDSAGPCRASLLGKQAERECVSGHAGRPPADVD